MIKVIFNKNSYEIIGHANYAPHGQDIVCAAVSTLATAITNELSDDATIEAEYGLIKVKLNSNNERTDVLVTTLLNGLTEISNQYPEYVKVCLEK